MTRKSYRFGRLVRLRCVVTGRYTLFGIGRANLIVGRRMSLPPIVTRPSLRLGPTQQGVVEDVHDELFDSLEDAPRPEVTVVTLRRDDTLRTQDREDRKG
jgi:hypothetical protein